MKKTLIFIHGADSFTEEEDYQDFLRDVFVPRYSKPWEDIAKPDWKLPIARTWVSQWGIVYYPTMPNKQNARYADWKLVFEGILAKLSPEDEVTLIWGSLGGCFLLKYFSENSQIKTHQIQQIHLIAACISEWDFTAPTSYDVMKSLGNRVHIWHAEDDPVVPFATAKELEQILSEAQPHFFQSEKWYGHFHGIERIPELEDILIDR